jgi:hypothetical protein
MGARFQCLQCELAEHPSWLEEQMEHLEMHLND